MKRDRFELANKLQGESLVRKGVTQNIRGATPDTD